MAGRLAIELPFRWGWWFFAIAAMLGALLRFSALRADSPFAYAHVLHAHSHVAMLGWIYNAFFAVALQVFVTPDERAGYRRLFLATQFATAGMLLTFPFQGYAPASIAFSALHLGCAAVFGWRIMRTVRLLPAARHALGWAFGFMFLSAAGPLALGPLAAAGLRDSGWFSFAVYFYLHFQYNGWFVCFLVAVLLRVETAAARRAVQWLAAGCLATLALSALWMNPPAWVRAVALAGSVIQLVAVARLGRMLGLPVALGSRAVHGLYRLGLAAFVAKFLLQLLATWPALLPLAVLRSSVVGFLHLVFLGAVTPILIALAIGFGWLRWRAITQAGIAVLLVGTAVTELILFFPALAALLGLTASGPWLPRLLAASAALMVAGIVATTAGFGPASRDGENATT
jgi:hypothetical protein